MPGQLAGGLITIWANYEGNPNTCSAPRRSTTWCRRSNETARFAFIVPTRRTSRSRSRSRCGPAATTACASPSRKSPSRSRSQCAKFTFWGMPGRRSHNAERFAKGSPGEPAGCPGWKTRAASTPANPASIAGQAADRQPDDLHRRTAGHRTRRPVLPGPRAPRPRGVRHTRRSTGCEQETFNPVLSASLTTDADRLAPPGSNLSFNVPQTLGFTPSPSQLKAVTVTLPAGLTINPDAADGQSACTDAQANFGTRGPGRMPGQREDRHGRDRHAGARRAADRLDLHRRTEAGRPVPALHDRSTASASTPSWSAPFQPDPATGQLTALFDDLPQVPFEDFDLHLFASDRGLMATPTHCTLYTVEARLRPLERRARRPDTPTSSSASTPGPSGAPCPGQVRPFHPRLVAGHVEPGRRRLQRLPPEARPRRRRPVPRRPQLQDAARLHRRPARDHLLPGGRDRGRGAEPGPRRAGAARAARPSSQIGTTNVAAGPGSHPFHASARCTWPGPFKGAPLSLVGDHPGARRALRLRRRRRPGRPPRRSARPLRSAPSRTRCRRSSAASRSGCARSRSTSTGPNFTINPTNCSPSRSTRRGSATRAR